MAFFDWNLENGKMWRIPLEDSVPKKRMFKIKHIVLTEAEQAREDMRQYYAEVLKQPVPAAEEEFAAAMIEAEKNPVAVVPEPVVHDENYIPPMPEYGSKEFFIWCSKTKKAREALKKKKEDEKAAAVAAKTAEKEAAAATKAAAKSAKDAAKAAKDAAKALKEAAKATKTADKAANTAIKAAAKNGGK